MDGELDQGQGVKTSTGSQRAAAAARRFGPWSRRKEGVESQRSLSSENGATALIVAGCLVMLMGVAAIALDAGMGFSERRQAQSAADFAALAALQGADCVDPTCDAGLSRDAGAEEAIDVVAANLPDQTLDWVSCTDPSPLPHASGLTDCVSFTANFDEARVHLPDAEIDTTFARVIGQDTLTIGSEAAAEQRLGQAGNILPFYAAPVTGSHVCLFSNQPSQSVAPCDGANAGNFGTLDVRLYGNDELGTTTSCAGNAGDRIESNIVLGADHNMFVRGSDPQVRDDVACPNRSANVNALQTQTGSSPGPAGDIERGLAGPSSVGPHRLRCGTGWTDTVRGTCLDDTPLWVHLIGDPCPGPFPTQRSEMEACLDAWGSGVIFEETIVEHPRFALIPVLDASPSGGGIGNIVAFQPIYLQTVYISKCDGSGVPCDTVFSPGETDDDDPCDDPALTSCGLLAPGNLSGPSVDIEAVTAFAIDPGMLPESVRDDLAGGSGTREMRLYE